MPISMRSKLAKIIGRWFFRIPRRTKKKNSIVKDILYFYHQKMIFIFIIKIYSWFSDKSFFLNFLSFFLLSLSFFLFYSKLSLKIYIIIEKGSKSVNQQILKFFFIKILNFLMKNIESNFFLYILRFHELMLI